MGGNAAEDKGIAAVKHATMTWDKIPGVLHTDPALNPRLDQVAEDTQYRNRDAAQQRHGNVELIKTSSIKNKPDDKRPADAAGEALPCLVGRDLGSHLVFAEPASNHIGKRIADPKRSADTDG